jgi:exodeoxyribonuclease V beta subunit
MESFSPFNLLDSGLHGTNLIEASAGTGKTYAICGLFLRLILEKHFSVNQIVVVTFTVAATQELRDRIRGRLREAIDTFSHGGSTDSFLNGLFQKSTEPKRALDRLKEAVRNFDEVAIFTIHGFCQRVLHEHAFESGSLFDTNLVTDQDYIKQGIVDDFWRKHFLNAEPELADYVLYTKKCRPQQFYELLGKVPVHPNIRIIPDVHAPEPHFVTHYNNTLSKLKQIWPQSKREVEGLLKNPAISGHAYGSTTIALDKKISNRDESVSHLIKAMDEFLASEGYHLPLFEGFEKFTASTLAASMKKNQEPPQHPVFTMCEALKKSTKVFDHYLLFLKSEIFGYAKDQMIMRKREHNIQFFDDLLLKVYTALKEEGGERLIEALRTRYKAALIDEFQDTDPIQYEIFNTVFSSKNSILFLIGDPKQAIYGFRGADIFTYMSAARRVDAKYTLTQNWRSEPELIAATNALFSAADKPFVYDGIPFVPSTASPKKQDDLFTINGHKEPPFHLWFKGRGTNLKSIPKYAAEEMIARSVAAEISRLLDLARKRKALIAEKPLREGDIAVLVRKHAEALAIQKTLSALGVPSVRYSTDNLFDSREAMEMEQILAAIIEPTEEGLVKAALSTDVLGLSGESLADLQSDEKSWETYLSTFLNCHNLWYKRGFLSAFRMFMSMEAIQQRLLAFSDGERRLTNVLHLSEVLHKRAIEKSLHPEGVLKWLAEQRKDSESPRLEEHQLRLESDENAVKLVTIHKSKGLEYPVVFCPFSWESSTVRGGDFMFHGDDDVLTLYLEGLSDDPNRGYAQRRVKDELLAEDIRLLYVALTRAKKRCYMVWGGFKNAENSALAYLLHQPKPLPQQTIAMTTAEKCKKLDDQELLNQLENLVQKSGGAIVISDFPEDEEAKYSPPEASREGLTCRRFHGAIKSDWRISSFSYLVSGPTHLAELPDRDAILYPEKEIEAAPPETEPVKEPLSIFTFPRGAKAGTLLHEILEQLDFTEKDSPLRKELIARKLKDYGLDLIWQEVIDSMVDRLLSVPLNAHGESFTLSRISNDDRLNELEFYFPLQPISPAKLRNILAGFKDMEEFSGFSEHIDRLCFSPTWGFMKGYMDMVFQYGERFYLIDWKSNYLGNKVEDYRAESLIQIMKQSYYVLQYLLYTVALNQYLALRLPGYRYDTHFGGVYYIFLRGVHPDHGPGFGIYRDLPPQELINELSRNLIPRSQ